MWSNPLRQSCKLDFNKSRSVGRLHNNYVLFIQSVSQCAYNYIIIHITLAILL